jgi:hypothetical protein
MTPSRPADFRARLPKVMKRLRSRATISRNLTARLVSYYTLVFMIDEERWCSPFAPSPSGKEWHRWATLKPCENGSHEMAGRFRLRSSIGDLREISSDDGPGNAGTPMPARSRPRSRAGRRRLPYGSLRTASSSNDALRIRNDYGGRGASTEVISQIRRWMYAIGDSATLVSPDPLRRSATPLAGSALRAGHPVFDTALVRARAGAPRPVDLPTEETENAARGEICLHLQGDLDLRHRLFLRVGRCRLGDIRIGNV